MLCCDNVARLRLEVVVESPTPSVLPQRPVAPLLRAGKETGTSNLHNRPAPSDDAERDRL